MLDGVLMSKPAKGGRVDIYQLKVSKRFKRQMLLMSVVIVDVLSDLGVKRSTPKLNYYLVLDFLIIERGECML